MSALGLKKGDKIKYRFEPRKKDQNPDHVIRHNIDLSNKLEISVWTWNACLSYFELHPGHTFADLERFLRAHDLNLRLIARPRTTPHRYVVPNGPQDCKYEAYLYENSPEVARKKMLLLWRNEEANLKALEQAGLPIPQETAAAEEVGERKRVFEMLAQGQHWLRVTLVLTPTRAPTQNEQKDLSC